MVIAKNVDELHSLTNNLTKQTALTEKGDLVKGRGDTPNEHDALTGSTMEGRAFPPGEDRTCKNWTSSTQGTAMLGHIDRAGIQDTVEGRSWNATHPSRGGGRRLQPERPQEHRRRRPVLLLRHELSDEIAVQDDRSRFQPTSVPLGPAQFTTAVSRALTDTRARRRFLGVTCRRH